MTIEDPKETAPVETPEPVQDDPIAAMQKGIEEANEEESAPIMPEVNDEPKADDKPAVEPDAPADPVAEPEPVALDKEMDDLGLKAKARERFTAMANQIAEFKPLQEALKAAGVEAGTIPEIVDKAKRADEFYAAVADTKAPPEEFARTMDILKRFNSGDVAQINTAYDDLVEVIKLWSPVLGRSVDGVDPFAAAPDIREMVEDGSISREMALEVVKARSADRLAATQAEVRSQTVAQQEAAQAEEQTARAALNDLGAHLFNTDPRYKEKFAVLEPIVAGIMETLPAKAWPEAVAKAYSRIQLPAVKPPVPPNPARPQGVRPVVVPQTDDPLEAMRFGIAQANGM